MSRSTLHFFLVLGISFFFLSNNVYSQNSTRSKSKEVAIVPKTDSDTKKKANVYLKDSNFSLALPLFLSLQKGNPKSGEYNYKVAICYVSSNSDKSKAIPYLEESLTQKDTPKDAVYYLGVAYHYANRFDDAIASYEKAKSVVTSKLAKEIPRLIAMCNNGKELVKNPLVVTFENLGPLINTPYPDYNPFISSDESILVFSTRRAGGNAADEFGVYNADIYYSTMRDYKWTKAKSIGSSINTSADEEALGLTADGKKLLIYTSESEGGNIGDIYFSNLTGKAWSQPKPYPESINSHDLETGATLTPDGSTMYFSSDNSVNGKGGRDLYKSNLLPDGGWSLPINLGTVINTEYDEDAPYIHSDGHTLYFSSKGHNSMGGFDIFKTVFNDETQTWSAPENLGYPINTSDDNLYFSLSVQGKYAYVSAVRPEGYGDLDIYKVNFKDIQRNSYSTIIQGQILTSDSNMNINAKVSFINKIDPEDFGQYTPSNTTGKFVISGKPGTFTMLVDAPGYKPYKEEITIPEIMQPHFLEKEILMVKK